MDQWVKDGKPVLPTHPLSFAYANSRLCFNRIRCELRLPSAHVHFPIELDSYSKSYDSVHPIGHRQPESTATCRVKPSTGRRKSAEAVVTPILSIGAFGFQSLHDSGIPSLSDYLMEGCRTSEGQGRLHSTSNSVRRPHGSSAWIAILSRLCRLRKGLQIVAEGLASWL